MTSRFPAARESSTSAARAEPTPRSPTWMIRSTWLISDARRIGRRVALADAVDLVAEIEVRVDLEDGDRAPPLVGAQDRDRDRVVAADADRHGAPLEDGGHRGSVVRASCPARRPGRRGRRRRRRSRGRRIGPSRSKSQWSTKRAMRCERRRTAAGASAHPAVAPGRGYGQPCGTPRMTTSASRLARSLSTGARGSRLSVGSFTHSRER